jgi:hypothetical protein
MVSNLFLFGTALLVVGLVLVMLAMRHRTASHPPIPSSDVKHWKPIWRMQDCYTPVGYKLQLVGWITVCGAAMLLAAGFLMPLV